MVYMIHEGNEGECNIGAVLCVDRERRHFLSSAGTTFPGANIYRESWRRIHRISQRTVVETHISDIVETYYAAPSMIHRHKRYR